MRTVFLLVLSLALTFPLPAGADLTPPSKESKLPFQIADYYENCNYVCSFSTRKERMELLDSLDSPEWPPEIKNRRLVNVFKRMKKIREHVTITDPEMVLKSKVPTPMSRNLFYRTEMVKVQTFRKIGDRLSVKLTIFELEPEDVIKFISEYTRRRAEEQVDSVIDMLQEFPSRIVKKTEYHEWSLHNGKWKRSDGSYLLLKR